jgi:dTDP-4-amino-4,6-dideoxygalactose transaminase
MSVNDRVRHESSKLIFEDHLEIGYNYRMTDIQASVGIEQLKKLDWIVSERRKIARAYIKAFANIDCISLPLESEGYFSNYQSFCVYLKPGCRIKRNDLMLQLLNKKIASRRGVMNTHRETAYKELYKDTSLPVSEDLQDNSIMLPIYVPMSKEDIDHVITTTLSFVRAQERVYSSF